MIGEIYKKIDGEFSGKGAINFLENIIRFHRIQISPDFRRAAEYVKETLSSLGITAEIVSIPIKEGEKLWNAPGFNGWWAKSAKLYIREPEERKIADWRESPFSLIQRSTPVSGDFELTYIEEGEKPEDYEGKDLRGKIILTKNPSIALRVGVWEKGAKGILSCRGKIEDALTYTSFWWSGEEPCKAFGFVITPGEGEKLLSMLKRGKKIILHAEIDSSFYEGNLDIVDAIIEGEGKEEVILISHLCHPKGEANDNASGVSSLMESARTLKELINRGELRKPKRSIRFLFVPEIYGTIAYLMKREDVMKRAICGLNLDMVGQNLDISGGSFLLDRTPDAIPSFSSDLLELIREWVIPKENVWGAGRKYPYIKYATLSFTGGSDHLVLSDPLVGIPTPMLIQWPDRYYHTDKDTIDKIDPASLKRSGVLASLYAYFVATAGERETLWLRNFMVEKFRRDILEEKIRRLRGEIDDSELIEKIRYKLERKIGDIKSLRKLHPISIENSIEKIKEFVYGELRGIKGRKGKSKEKSSPVPVRKGKGPIFPEAYLPKLEPKERIKWLSLLQEAREEKEKLHDLFLPFFWMDGRRNLDEIYRLIKLETGCEVNRKLLDYYFELLECIGLIELRRP
jgi:hypothetical protein